MKKFVRKKDGPKENIHLQVESTNVLVKIIYSPLSTSNEFLYSIIINNKETNYETKHSIGFFNMTKAKYALGNIVLSEDLVKIVPKQRTTSVYNLHEKDTKVYVFSL